MAVQSGQWSSSICLKMTSWCRSSSVFVSSVTLKKIICSQPSRLPCYPPLHPAPAFPCCADHGEWAFLEIRQAQSFSQMAEEHVQGDHGRLLLVGVMGGKQRVGQVRLPDRIIRLVSRSAWISECGASLTISQHPSLLHLPTASSPESCGSISDGKVTRLPHAHLWNRRWHLHDCADPSKSFHP